MFNITARDMSAAMAGGAGTCFAMNEYFVAWFCLLFGLLFLQIAKEKGQLG